MGRKTYLLSLLGLLLISSLCLAEEEKTEEKTETEPPTVDEDVGKSRDGSKTDDEAVQREEEAIKLDGLNVAQMKELREKAEKFAFQAEVSRMMKLIINSLYRNKEIFLRELISNSSDALDKIRFLSLTDKSALAATEELSIKIKADKENNILHVTDTGIGMTKDDLVKNLGTIAKSGTSEFFQKMADAQSSDQASDLIGQFGVGFYSSFLVADRVIVTSKHNDDKQYIWESDAASFSITEDPRGNTLQRGTTVSVHLKEEARDFLEPETIKDLVKKYSQFINFNIYLWTSKTEEVEEPVEEEASTDDKKADESAEDKKEEKDEEKEEEKKDEEKEDKDDDVEVEEESEEKEKKPKTKKVEKTTWDWELINTNKPIWSRKPKDVKDDEYNDFYKSFTKDHDNPLAKTHFVAEGEVTFRSILYVPKSAPHNLFSEYGKKMDQIKLYVRRVFITDNFEDMMPKYLSFIRGVVDSDDLPLNVSRETLQQHKLLKVIKKKLVRKALDMIKKIPKEDYMDKFWKEFSTSIKLGVMEDHSNRTRLAKLLRFYSSNSEKEMTSLADYVERMKEKQEAIYFMAGTSRKEVESSPFVEKLLKKGYEVLYLIEPVDEYCIQSLPEFEGKKFQNVAKEGLKIGEESEKQKKKQAALESTYEPLLKWLKDDALKDLIEKAAISQRLDESPCALVASSYGWSGNMERIMRSQAYAKSSDPSNEYYANQKKTLEVNPRHPLVKELLKRVETDKEDKTAKDLARVLFETATLRSGYLVKDSQDFAGRIERMLRLSMGVDLEAMVEPEEEEAEEKEEEDKDGEEIDAEGDKEEKTEEESASPEEGATEGETKTDEKEDEVEDESKEAPASNLTRSYQTICERNTLSLMAPQAEQMQIVVASSCYCFASVGMLLFNKFAVQDFPLECCLVWAQLFFAASCLSLFAFPYIHVGSARDLFRWCMVVPFYCGMLLTSILALKTAPMSLVIVLRNTSPLGTLLIERFYPEPLRISGFMLGSICLMIAGGVMYVTQLPAENWKGIGWVFLNSIIAVVDRLLQRLLLSKEQCPVDISKTGITLINNMVGLLPVGIAAYAKGEIDKLPLVYGTLSHWDKFYIGMTCIIGLTISYTSIWAQSLISATSFLVMINANKFVIIGIEAFGMHSKALQFGCRTQIGYTTFARR